jgi:hypothetical protein
LNRILPGWVLDPRGTQHMSNDRETKHADANAKIEREIRRERKFSLADAIGQLAGPGAMKGESPIARMQQAAVEIETWLRYRMADAGGALQVVLLRGVTESELLLKNFEKPLIVLVGYIQRILDSEYLLKKLVGEADIEWGRTLGERPHFEQEKSPPDADDPYTFASVRSTLSGLLKELALDMEKNLATAKLSGLAT